jgi:hypothetical protein
VREAPRLREPVWESRLLGRALRYIDAHPLSLVEATFDNTERALELDGSLEWESSAASISIARATARIGVLSLWAVAILAVVGAFTSYARGAAMVVARAAAHVPRRRLGADGHAALPRAA